MDNLQDIEVRREAILREMLSIRAMRRGTLNEQYFKVAVRGGRGEAIRGPYFVLSRREGDKTVSRRVRPEELERVREGLAAHKRLKELCREFEELTERMGTLAQNTGEDKKKARRRR
jgi:hypothetical protein